jgi:hypothetical protein
MVKTTNSNFLIRVKINRRKNNESITINDVIKSAKNREKYKINYMDKNGDKITANLEIKFERIIIKPSYGLKAKLYPDTEVTIISAKEIKKIKEILLTGKLLQICPLYRLEKQ